MCDVLIVEYGITFERRAQLFCTVKWVVCNTSLMRPLKRSTILLFCGCPGGIRRCSIPNKMHSRSKECGLQVTHQAKRGQPLSACQKGRNRHIAKVWARVEPVFAGLHHMGQQEFRSIGLARTPLQITMKWVVYYPKRWVNRRRCGMAAF